MAQGNLNAWIDRQARYSASAMELCISATDVTKTREAFDQVITPVKGSVVASRQLSDWNPNPDYFFDWQRDGAIILGALNVLIRNADNEEDSQRWRGHFDDIVDFNVRFLKQNGKTLFAHKDFSKVKLPQFLRDRAELCSLSGNILHAEPRRNPDGTPNILKWTGAQFDGIAKRAIECMEYKAFCQLQGYKYTKKLDKLIALDLGFTSNYADAACVGPWEEDHEVDHHYYTGVVQLGAMTHGAVWADNYVSPRLAAKFDSAARFIERGLEKNQCGTFGVYKALRSAKTNSYQKALEALDSNIILGINHARLEGLKHSCEDRAAHRTLIYLEKMYRDFYPLNKNRPFNEAPALGRNRQDKFLGVPGGNPWFNTTLSAAEFLYNASANNHVENVSRQNCFRRAEAYMKTVQKFTPESGVLTEQFDRVTGVPVSCELAWSHAAMVTAADARRNAVRVLGL